MNTEFPSHLGLLDLDVVTRICAVMAEPFICIFMVYLYKFAYAMLKSSWRPLNHQL